jgi:hypothetical protein
MSEELNCTTKIIWKAEILLSNDTLHKQNVTLTDLKSYIKNIYKPTKQLENVDVINKYVVSYIQYLFGYNIYKIKYIIIRKT